MILFSFNRSAYAVQLLLRMDRVDLAQQRLALMKSVDDESILTQLATAWVNMRLVSFIYLFISSISISI